MPDVAQLTAEAVGASGKRFAAANSVLSAGYRLPLWRLAVLTNVVGIVVLATVLRCRDLANVPGINGDEAWYGVQAEFLLRGQPIPWRTPSGNLLNPLFFGPQLAIHAIFEPSFVLLRASAVVSGMFALVVNFCLCRRVFGRHLAIISTCILAVLPIDIAYSRLAWDASQSLLVTLPCIYLSLWAIIDVRLRFRCTAGALAALAISIVVHPTNLFVGPIAIVCLTYAWRDELRQTSRRAIGWCPLPWRRIAFWAAAGGICASLVGVSLTLGLRPAWLGSAAARIANPLQYQAFAANFARLFSGATVYEYVSGALLSSAASTATEAGIRWDCVPYDATAWLVAGWLAWGFVRAMRRSRPELICLAIGWGASLFGFFLVAGPAALAPHFERYAIWMVGPTTILASVAIAWWQTRTSRVGWLSTVFAIALGWALLIGFQTNCFDFIRQTGGRSHQTFRTAAVEPKQAALAYILAQGKPGSTVRIATSQWWIYWPMRYLNFGTLPQDEESKVTIELQTIAESSAALRTGIDSKRGQIWYVEFTDSPACKTIRQAVRGVGDASSRENTIDDFAGRPILSLFDVSSHWKERAVLPRIVSGSEQGNSGVGKN
jgi:hypothetical protein